MKNAKYIISILAFIIIFIVSSCSDPCENVECINGECIEGVCDCIPGYEGEDCETSIKSKYYGDYIMLTESCSGAGSGMIPYNITIRDSPISEAGPLSFYIVGLYGKESESATATLDANGVDFTFSRNVFGFFGIVMDGSGSIDTSDNSIQITYKRYDAETGDEVDECTGTIVKL